MFIFPLLHGDIFVIYHDKNNLTNFNLCNVTG